MRPEAGLNGHRRHPRGADAGSVIPAPAQDLDGVPVKVIADHGAGLSFRKFTAGFPAICTSVDDIVVRSVGPGPSLEGRRHHLHRHWGAIVDWLAQRRHLHLRPGGAVTRNA